MQSRHAIISFPPCLSWKWSKTLKQLFLPYKGNELQGFVCILVSVIACGLYISRWWHAKKTVCNAWYKIRWAFCPEWRGWYCSKPIQEAKFIKKGWKSAFCNLWTAKYISHNQP